MLEAHLDWEARKFYPLDKNLVTAKNAGEARLAKLVTVILTVAFHS